MPDEEQTEDIILWTDESDQARQLEESLRDCKYSVRRISSGSRAPVARAASQLFFGYGQINTYLLWRRQPPMGSR
jgi:hypothetical protein